MEAQLEPGSLPRAGFLGALRDSLSGRTHDFTRGSLPRAVLLLAVPMVLEMAMESLFAIVDVLFVSKLGDEAVATVGLTEAMLTIVYSVAIGISMAVTSMVARRIGAQDRDGAVLAATQAVFVGGVFGVLLGLPCFFLGDELLALMGASEEVVATGGGYTSILLGTNVVVLLLFLNNAVFRGAGDAVLAMRALWLANAVNIVLDPCLIFGLGPFPELGLEGAAIATAIGRGTGVVYQLRGLRRGRGRIALRGPSFRFDRARTAELLRLSVGGVGQFLIATASWVALVRIIAPFGETSVAGYTVAIRIVTFTLMPAFGISNAAATLVGQNLGAQQPERARRAVWLTGAYTCAFLCVVMVLFVALAPILVRPFSSSPETADVAARALRTMSYGYPMYAWGMVMMQAFNGAGRTMVPTGLNLIAFWMIETPLAWILAHPFELGPAGVFWSIAIAESLLAAISIATFRLLKLR